MNHNKQTDKTREIEAIINDVQEGTLGNVDATNKLLSLLHQSNEEKDYIVVKTMDEAVAFTTHKSPKSLQGKYVIVAPNGLEFVSKEDIAKLPQVKALLNTEVEKSNNLLAKRFRVREMEYTTKAYDKGYREGVNAENYRWMNQPANEHDKQIREDEQRKALSDIGGGK